MHTVQCSLMSIKEACPGPNLCLEPTPAPGLQLFPAEAEGLYCFEYQAASTPVMSNLRSAIRANISSRLLGAERNPEMKEPGERRSFRHFSALCCVPAILPIINRFEGVESCEGPITTICSQANSISH